MRKISINDPVIYIKEKETKICQMWDTTHDVSLNQSSGKLW